jgi:hypothetical protein
MLRPVFSMSNTDSSRLNQVLGENQADLPRLTRRAWYPSRASKQAWGEKEFVRRMQEWGKLGGRPKGSRKKRTKQSWQVMAVYQGKRFQESTGATSKTVAKEYEKRARLNWNLRQRACRQIKRPHAFER